MLAALLLFVAACGSGSGGGRADRTPSATQPPAPPVAEVAYQPGNGTTQVGPRDDVGITVADGHIDEVALTNADGERVQGKLLGGGSGWTVTEPLGYGKTYTWSGTATGADGRSVPIRGSFRTVQPDRIVRATITPVDDVTVGIAMPISIEFEAPVENKAAVQRVLEVHTSKPVEGSWAWLHDQEVHWRPREYWPAHTRVSVNAPLYGVDYGNGKYGKVDLTTEFTIGRAQVVKANVDSHRLVVIRDGEQIANYPASYGRPGNPDLHTHNGTYIVMAKHRVELMSNPKYGYTDVKKKWAVRISNHGEFIHENEANRANIGKRNTSHGCINLTNADAKEYFHSALIGDPVEVTGSSTDMPPRYAVYDWMLSWQQWKSMSAL